MVSPRTLSNRTIWLRTCFSRSRPGATSISSGPDSVKNRPQRRAHHNSRKGWISRTTPSAPGRWLRPGCRDRPRIKNLYTAHEQLRVAWAGGVAAELEHAYTAWDDTLGVIHAERTKQMASPGLQEPAKKALATLDREWDGLIAHRDYPMISLDNNAAERALRRPVVTRKNAYGSRTEDAARLAARVWTITATTEMAGLNPITYLTAYLDTCGRTGGKPPTGLNLERFLPWTATREDLDTWAQPPRPG